jgi:hypothetical protein
MATGLKKKLVTAREQVREAYKNGATLRQIADLHGTSVGTVRNLLIEMGENLRPRGRRHNSKAPKVLATLPDGSTAPAKESYEGGPF